MSTVLNEPPEMMEMELTPELLAEFRTGRQMDLQMAHKRQRLAQQVKGERKDMSFGHVSMQMDPYFYHHFGRKYGYQCWDDDDFVNDTLKHNPECKVTSRSEKIQVGYTPTKKRFHKSYGELK